MQENKAKHHKSNKMARTNAHLSIITLNINGLNLLIKKAQTSRLHQKGGTIYLLPLRDTTKYKSQTLP